MLRKLCTYVECLSFISGYGKFGGMELESLKSFAGPLLSTP